MDSAFSIRFLVGAVAIAASSCGPVRTQDRLCQAKKVWGENSADNAEFEAYFPKGFSEEPIPDRCGIARPRLSGHQTEWYSKQWRTACEPPLLDVAVPGKSNQFLFRFSFLPTFDPPLFMRLETHDRGHRLVVKEMTGAGGYDPGVIGRSKEIELSEEEVAAIRQSLSDIRADRDADIDRSRREGPKATCFGGFDGTMWIFETVESGRYDLVQIHSPRDGPIFELGAFLLSKTGWVESPNN